MTTDFDAAAEVVRAGDPLDVFGPPPEPGRPVSAAAKDRYRRLARLLHPDRAPHARTAEATAAFARLGELWRSHRDGADHPDLLTCNGTDYQIGAQLVAGDLANLYRLRHREGAGADVIVKLARDPADNDLMRAEASALRQIASNGDRRFAAYVPRLAGTFIHRDPHTDVTRQANLLPVLTGFVTLAEVADAFPDGVDPRDAAWMMRRLLVGLGYAHRAGVVHGAVLPEHVMIHPEAHGLVIVDWCYRPAPGRPIAAMVSRYAGWYPPEVGAKQPADASTDLYLAARCLDHLVKDRQPARMRDFIRGCTLRRQRARPRDAWQLLSEFDDLLSQLYGPRRFRPFQLPPTRKSHC